MRDAFERESERVGDVELGFRGGSLKARVRLVRGSRLWWGSGIVEQRYWNAFGLGDPFTGTPAIAVEVNAPLEGRSGRVAGAFVRDAQGRVWLAHSGKVGGGARGVGAAAFSAWYEQRGAEPATVDGARPMFLIGALDDPLLSRRIGEFVERVLDFKAQVRDIEAPLAARATSRFDVLAAWCAVARAWDGHEEHERSAKLAAGALLAEARVALVARGARGGAQDEADTWRARLDLALRKLPGNFVFHVTRSRVRAWAREHVDEAERALEALWSGEGSGPERVARFLPAWESGDVEGAGTRLNVASVLLLGLDATAYPLFKKEFVEHAFAAAGVARPEGPVALYAAEIELLERLGTEASTAAAPMRDLLDVQGALWSVLESPAFLASRDARQRVLLERYRAGEFDLPPGDQTSGDDPIMPNQPLNQILYGPPGTGKTFHTMALALAICGEPYTEATRVATYRRLVDEGRVRFVTFHQSFAYEEFVEGIRPVLRADGGGLEYTVKRGVFREMCDLALGARRAAAGADVDGVSSSQRIWKMSLGQRGKKLDAGLFAKCLADGRLRLGWGRGVDLTGCATRDAIEKRLREARPDRDFRPMAFSAPHLLVNELQDGDLVVIPDGNTRFRAIGRVRGPYLGIDTDGGFQMRGVDWLADFSEASQPVELIYGGRFTQRTLYELDGALVNHAGLTRALGHGVGAASDGPPLPCVLVIDEINRANVSKVFGELITLLEPDKRLGGANEQRVTLPYSGDTFGVPSNLYVVGTMNTADRSIAFLDLALRRRFQFVAVQPRPELLAGVNLGEVDLAELLSCLNERIELLLDRDHALGHAFLIDVGSLGRLREIFVQRIVPQLLEYFAQDWSKVASVLGCPVRESGATSNPLPLVRATVLRARVLLGTDEDFDDRLRFDLDEGFLAADEDGLAPYFLGVIHGAARG